MRNYVQGQATLNLRFYQDKTAVLQQFSRIKIKSSPNACSPSISAFNCRVKRFFYFFAGFSGKETAGKITFRIRRTVSKSTPSDMHIKRIQRSRILRLRRVAQATFFHSAAVRILAERAFYCHEKLPPATENQNSLLPGASFYPSATSSTIINTNPTANPTVPRFECSPSEASGISSSTTT